MPTNFPAAEAGALLPVALIVLKATAVLLIALALTSLMQRASATSRHLVWMASLSALLAIPALAVWSPIRFAVLPTSWGVAPVAAAVIGAQVDAAPADNVQRAVQAPASPTRSQSSAEAVSAAPGNNDGAAPMSTITIVTLGWAAIAAALLSWLAYGALSVRRITSKAIPLDGTEWQGTMIDIADRIELAAIPRLLRSPDVTMPFACGLRTPTIVLPADSVSWTSERRAAVLLHELAHIRRRDIVGHTVSRVVCALYWFHPLAWTAARRLRAESERACDDLALSCGTRASDYAEHLLEIVTSVRNHATPSVAMAMATRSEFEGRMLAILDPSLMRTAPTRVQASTLAGGVMMFAIVAGSAVPKVAVAADPNAPIANRAEMNTPQTPESSQRIVAGGDTALAMRSELRTERRVADPVPSASPAAVSVVAAAPQAVTAVDAPNARSLVDSSARATVLARILRTDSSASLRRTAAWGLNDFTDNDTALDALLSAVRRDPSATVREMAAWSLSDAADRGSVAGVLADVVQSERDRIVRETAVWSLADGANGRSVEAIAALSSALRDQDANIREMAAWGIGNAGPRRAPVALVTALADPNARVRATVAWALFQIEDGESASAIESALQKEMDADAKWALVRAISVMGERAVAPLQRLIESSNAPLRALAIRSLAGQGADPWPQPRPRPRPFP